MPSVVCGRRRHRPTEVPDGDGSARRARHRGRSSGVAPELSLDVAFISSNSWDLSHGVTTPVEAKIDAKRAAIAAAETSVLVAGSSKYGRFGKYRALRLDELDTVVTDDGLPADAAVALRDAGVALSLARR